MQGLCISSVSSELQVFYTSYSSMIRKIKEKYEAAGLIMKIPKCKYLIEGKDEICDLNRKAVVRILSRKKYTREEQ